MLPIFLASSSPRRQELLNRAGVQFSVMSVDIDESISMGESPTDYIQRMVQQKAQCAISKICTGEVGQVDRHCIVITADTIGVLPDGTHILVKPKDQQDAFNMWQQMSDCTHEVWTAVCLSVINPSANLAPKNLQPYRTSINQTINPPLSQFFNPTFNQYAAWISTTTIFQKTQVTFVPLTEQMMLDYWSTGEPQDKAGAYAIQGRGAMWVASINGSYTNVVGLPLAQTLQALQTLQAPYRA